MQVTLEIGSFTEKIYSMKVEFKYIKIYENNFSQRQTVDGLKVSDLSYFRIEKSEYNESKCTLLLVTN